MPPLATRQPCRAARRALIRRCCICHAPAPPPITRRDEPWRRWNIQEAWRDGARPIRMNIAVHRTGWSAWGIDHGRILLVCPCSSPWMAGAHLEVPEGRAAETLMSCMVADLVPRLLRLAAALDARN